MKKKLFINHYAEAIKKKREEEFSISFLNGLSILLLISKIGSGGTSCRMCF